MECRYCNAPCIRKGFVKQVQRFLCRACKRYQQESYTYKKPGAQIRPAIIRCIRTSNGIRDTTAHTGLAPSSVIRAIRCFASQVHKPQLQERNQVYEMDEMHLSVAGQKDIYLAYALNIRTGKIIDFSVGKRTKEMIGKVTSTVLKLNPKRIYTDGLNLYPGLIGGEVHKADKRFTVHVERMNGTLRTHLKRFSKSGLSFSRSVGMIEACMKLYLWG